MIVLTARGTLSPARNLLHRSLGGRRRPHVSHAPVLVVAPLEAEVLARPQRVLDPASDAAVPAVAAVVGPGGGGGGVEELFLRVEEEKLFRLNYLNIIYLGINEVGISTRRRSFV